MRKYNVIIQEVLERNIEVEANNFNDAKNKVYDMYKNEEVVLDYNDLIHTYIQDEENSQEED